MASTTKRRVRKRKLVKPKKGQKKKMETQTELAVKVPLCAVTDVLLPSLLTMAQQHPANIAIRTHILAAIKQPLPDEAQTWEQIKEWIEYNIKKPDRPIIPAPEPAAPRGPVPAFTVPVNLGDVEYGRCDYQVDRQGTANAGIPGTELMRLVVRQEELANPRGMTGLIDDVIEWLKDEAWEIVDMDVDMERARYTEHEQDHTSDPSSYVDRTVVLRAIETYLAQNNAADLVWLHEHDRPETGDDEDEVVDDPDED